ncbi:MAG: polyprenyl synthetase family protein [Kiritimatiellaeota bacterium]|nr:polyprenyl synthetase family protein [Kiritimatiellota bacterium]
MFDLQHYLDNNIQLINTALDRRLPAETERPAALHKAMRYSVFSGGKRLRPVLCLAAAEASLQANLPAPERLRQAGDTALTAALAIEILHTYTLIHDDLPSMDDDTLRRGQPTLHIVAGEANAILAGDALLTLAFEWLAELHAPPPYPPNQLSLELAHAAGSRGVVGGQAEDLAAEGRAADPDTVDYIHRHKTAALLRAAVRMGGITAGAGDSALAALTAYGDAIGLAFQIVDDILNETSTAATLGKAAGSDRQHGKMTYVAVHGLATARERARQLTEDAMTALLPLSGNREPLTALARWMIERTY